jgi:hypothetical protein
MSFFYYEIFRNEIFRNENILLLLRHQFRIKKQWKIRLNLVQ